MGIKKGKTDYLLSLIREGKSMTLGQQLRLTAYLSVPAIMAQVSSIAMQYIDASMVGSLGANAAASIGLVSTTTWLFWGLCAAAATGFSVQVAHRIGAGDFAGAKKILRQSVTATLVFSSLLAVVGISISGVLPGWLGGDEMIRSDSSFYFRIFSLFLPALQLNFLAGGMLRCSGNMRVPSMLNVLMCFWDVVFNFFLIFPTRQVDWWGWEFIVPGVGLGVEGAVLGTVLAELITAGGMMWYLCRRSSMLRLSGGQGSFLPRKETLRQAVRISLPMGFEHIAICGAQIMTTVIVAPLGIVAIAANSFAIIAESLCYMPGYGISEAATTFRPESWSKPYPVTQAFCQHYRLVRDADYGSHGSADVCGGPSDHRSDDACGGNPHVGNRDSADRSFCGADVCGIYRRLRCICGCGQYICSQSDEFWQYLGCPADTGSMACPYDGATGRMACHVY